MKKWLAAMVLLAMALPTVAFAEYDAEIEAAPVDETVEEFTLSLDGELPLELAEPELLGEEVEIAAPEDAEPAVAEEVSAAEPALPKAAGVPLDEAHFPDEDFRGYLSANCDLNGDGALSDDEISRITKYNNYNVRATSLVGIRYLKSLEELNCDCSYLSSLDVSKLTALRTIQCSDCSLTSLNLSGCTALTSVDANYDNKLTSVTLSGCTALKELYLISNELTQLDLSGCPNLETLSFQENPMDRIDVSGCMALKYLNLCDCQLESLDVSKHDKLLELTCDRNRLTSLNLSGCKALKSLCCKKNQLSEIDVSDSPNLQDITCYGNPMTLLDISGCEKLIEAFGNDPDIGKNNKKYASYGYMIYCDKKLEIVKDGKISLSSADVAHTDVKLEYDGKAKTPAVTVTLNGKTLTRDTDYTVSYKDNVEPGTATVTVKGINKYKGKAVATFEIVATKKPKLAAKEATVSVGGKHVLLAADSPVAAADCDFKSSDKSVATVSKKGVVKGVAPGEVTITAKPKEGGKSVKCKVTVVKPVESITLNKTTATIKKGKTKQLEATVLPKDATNRKVKWTSSDTSVATVDSKGLVTALKVGEATITAKAKDGSKVKAKCKVTVIRPVKSITVNKTTVTIKKGKTKQLKASVLPENATNRKVKWTSSDTSVATVDSKGLVTALKVGEATITAKAKDGSKVKAKCKVKVKKSSNWVLAMLSDGTKELKVGGSTKLSAATTDGVTVTWSSSDSNVAKVSSKGKVTGVGEGKAKITATASKQDSLGNKKVSVTITVKANGKKVTSITLNHTKAIIKTGKQLQLSAKVKPDDAANKEIEWATSDNSIATVDGNGLVTGKKQGKVTITAKAKDGSGLQQSCALTVCEFKLSAKTRNLGFGESVTVEAKVPPLKTANLSFTVDDESVATINATKGILSAKSKQGTVNVTAEVVVGKTSVKEKLKFWVWGAKSYEGFTGMALAEIKSNANQKILDALDKLYTGMEGEMTTTQSALQNKVAASIGIQMANGVGVENNVTKAQLDEFIRQFTEMIDPEELKAKDFSDCKTSADLVNAIAILLMDGTKGVHTYQLNGETYTMVINSMPGPSSAYVQGTVTFPNNKKYIWGGTKTSITSVKDQLDYLRLYGNAKIEDARKAVKDTIKKTTSELLGIDELIKAAKDCVSKSTKDMLKSRFGSYYTRAEAVVNAGTKFNDLKKKVKDIMPPDLQNELLPGVIKQVAGYGKKFTAFTDAVEKIGEK